MREVKREGKRKCEFLKNQKPFRGKDFIYFDGKLQKNKELLPLTCVQYDLGYDLIRFK